MGGGGGEPARANDDLHTTVLLLEDALLRRHAGVEPPDSGHFAAVSGERVLYHYDSEWLNLREMRRELEAKLRVQVRRTAKLARAERGGR